MSLSFHNSSATKVYPSPDKAKKKKQPPFYNTLIKQVRLWHWVSAALFCVAMIFFAATGFMLNHDDGIFAPHMTTTQRRANIPPQLLASLQQPLKEMSLSKPIKDNGDVDWSRLTANEIHQALPDDVSKWLKENNFPVRKQATWTKDFVYFMAPKLGGREKLLIERDNGHLHYEYTSRGWIGFADDLHRGSGTNAVWKLFMDLLAIACLVFSISGLWLLQVHAKKRPSTWPLVIAGVVIPIIIIVMIFHS
ncbi:PepSY-associated TM helix domain-containing protein [Zymomonas mobilis]|uniref:PepSY-associated TM helix domain protein n=1 Tax=Zymomonas mobilis subsp. pomaceae (strain ATCC 29192 / DSM 22645 / JCM 10191 / CCUG 17912 / NBRC 13757 / NCIMB 11200 / NRRL B-4491 / Barker I) TaxID=579138 RepID=F8ESL0_ZYMMT|nr:PepSY-associated TM helix domain-containing protein [Zymomonas mobilis]AEI37785.1 PepSY-associated TM helix domain protein [Zymomonas mobilis subsp. pomaceae ATCC 29192]MDX5949152.1 PepSY-associated TM helix domain-containing protein [Zymomonas mobilis subsp. pomaceae]GEB89788.1 membrane protein [Zymomonas mobilis subsp. pomaceae]